MFDTATYSPVPVLDDTPSPRSSLDPVPRNRVHGLSAGGELPSFEEIEAQIEDIFQYLIRHPGSHPGAVAAGIDARPAEVTEHLRRGRGRLFSALEGRWYPVPAADPATALAWAG